MKNLDKVIGFKKSEILQIIKEFDPTFSFDSHSDNAIHHPKPLESKHQQQIADLQAENAHLKAHIAELESQLNQANITPAFDVLLDTKHEYHAPDLAHAVRLWLDIYANGKPKDDSHTNLANVWISKHTNYNAHDDGYQMMQNRIREIATPLKDFGKKRIKESKK